MIRRRPLSVEQLEDRLAPATSGVTWPDGMHMTLSFAPDGTRVGTYTSNLFATLNPVAQTDLWERDILRAFQTWAMNANINVSVVADDGSPLGTAGAVQSDLRFGDIRIAAIPLPDGTLATNTGFQWSGTTWSGDVLLNSNYLFSLANGQAQSGTYDLFTAMLNEAGNVFGVLDSQTDPTSGVYYTYNGAKTGLNANDVADIQSLYAVRSQDRFDANKGNNTLATASGVYGTSDQMTLEADITTSTDVDCYKITIPTTSSSFVGFSVTLGTSGLSSLQGALQIYDSNNNLVGTSNATAPGQDLSIDVGRVGTGCDYYIRVSGKGDSFGIGSYRLKVVFKYADVATSGGATSSTSVIPVVNNDNHTNDTIAQATTLPSGSCGKTDARFDYLYTACLIDRTDIDFYKVKATKMAGPQKLNVIVWDVSQDGPAMKVEVFDARGNLINTARILGNEGGTFSLELANTTPGDTYYIKVSALNPNGSQTTGNYFLGVNFSNQPPTALNTLSSGTLTATANQAEQTLNVTQNELFQFLLGVNSGPTGAWTEVRMDIVDTNGNTVFTMYNYSGMPTASGEAYLAAGTYTIRMTATSPDGSTLPPIDYTLIANVISDPIGPTKTSTSSGTTSTSGGTTTTTTTSSTKLKY